MTLVTVVGNVNADIVARPLLELPPPGGDLLVDTIEVRVGGAAANAGMALARLGLAPRVIGAVGDDYLGRFAMDSLRDIGLARDVRVLPEVSTGVSICVEAPGKDRAFISMRGALDRFDASMVPADALACSFLLLCGYFTLSSLRGGPALTLLQRARHQEQRCCSTPTWTRKVGRPLLVARSRTCCPWWTASSRTSTRPAA